MKAVKAESQMRAPAGGVPVMAEYPVRAESRMWPRVGGIL